MICCKGFDSNSSNYYFDNSPKRFCDAHLGDQVHVLIFCSVYVALINVKLGTCVIDLLIRILQTPGLQFLANKCQNSFLATCQLSQNNYCNQVSYIIIL
jgi:hypothetical protein